MSEHVPPEHEAAHDREVAGIRCLRVLELLPDYLDDTLSHETRAQIDGHLAGCSWCEQFGGAYVRTVSALRGLRAESSAGAVAEPDEG